jgi:hypothetical protein
LIRRGPAAALLLALAGVLSACGMGAEPLTCPPVVTVPEAASLVKFTGTGRDLTDVLFEAQVQAEGVQCRLNKGTLETEIKVNLAALLGPANPERVARLRYFVAIATKAEEVLARAEFDSELAFEGNRTRVATRDELEQRFKLKAGTTSADYRIYVGFALSPEELEYNRENR